MEGSCQCGKIKFTTPTPKPLKIYICHCLECRHQSSSLFGVTFKFPTFSLNPPSPNDIGIFSRKTDSGNITNCYFCTTCGSRLIHAKDGASTISVKAGCLEGLETLDVWKNATHIWCKRAVVPIPEGVEMWDGEPPR